MNSSLIHLITRKLFYNYKEYFIYSSHNTLIFLKIIMNKPSSLIILITCQLFYNVNEYFIS